jgi:hypothetical protein
MTRLAANRSVARDSNNHHEGIITELLFSNHNSNIRR